MEKDFFFNIKKMYSHSRFSALKPLLAPYWHDWTCVALNVQQILGTLISRKAFQSFGQPLPLPKIRKELIFRDFFCSDPFLTMNTNSFPYDEYKFLNKWASTKSRWSLKNAWHINLGLLYWRIQRLNVYHSSFAFIIKQSVVKGAPTGVPGSILTIHSA